MERAGVAVSVRGLIHRYRTRDGALVVLDGVALEVPAGGYVAVTGPSGAGKSTLLSVLGGLEPLQGGRAVVGPTDLAGLGGDELAAYRRATVGFVFQHFGLLETLTAAENVELAGTLAGTRPGVRRRRARELLAAVGLDHRADHRPLELSGGERQRVAIARALTNEPRLVLADEPTGNLDPEVTLDIMELFKGANARGTTIIMATHDRSLIRQFPRRVVSLDAGSLAVDDMPLFRGRTEATGQS